MEDPAGAPICPVAFECGGCPLIHLPAAHQREHKLASVQRELHAAGLDVKAPEWIAHDGPTGYRNRVRLRLDDGRPTFFNPNKLPECAVLEQPLRAELLRLTDWSRSHRSWLRGFSHLELRAPDRYGRSGLSLTPNTELGVNAGVLSSDEPSALAEELSCLLWVTGDGEPPVQRLELLELEVGMPLSAFNQVNRWVNRQLVSKVRELVLRFSPQSFLDLYCGAGNLSLPLLKAGVWGRGVECHTSAIRALVDSAMRLGCEVGEQDFFVGDAAAAASALAKAGAPFDVVIVNPPRAGVRGQISDIALLAEHAVICCYCSPKSFARDVASLCDAGFGLEGLWVADMFPHTAHCEVLGLLTRQRRG